MKRPICAIIAIIAAVSAFAQKQGDVAVDSVVLARNGDRVQLAMNVNIGTARMDPNAIVRITPRLVGEEDSIDFPQVVVQGRNSYYATVRHADKHKENTDAFLIRYKEGPRTERYARTIDHQQWMDNSTLKIIWDSGTPCGLTTTGESRHQAFAATKPDTTYVEHPSTEKEQRNGTVSGQARIQFIVNKTDFVPTLADNKRELEKMHQSIRQVQQDKRVRVTKYRIKGYASPEGPWDNNDRLARGRTERLRDFMVNRWGVPQEQIDISSEAEDWEGFRNHVDTHRDIYAHADDIIDIIDCDMDPDAKLAKIAASHPYAYKRILHECFPMLRRTEYYINYEWVDIVERRGKSTYDTIVSTRPTKADDMLEDNVYTIYRPTKPWIALKTNMLFDLLLTPNVEIELPIGDRWSIMAEDWFPWLLSNKQKNISIGKHIAPGNYMKNSAYELWTLGAELRYWWPRACAQDRARLTGHFLGLYYANGKYDLEWDSKGDQGEFNSVGLTYGHCWPIARHWNLEASISAGALWGPRRHYEGEFDDTHLIWKYTGHTFYAGPTKLKLSLVWLIPAIRKQKGGLK